MAEELNEERLKSIIHRLEGVLRTTPNPEQKERVAAQIRDYRNQLHEASKGQTNPRATAKESVSKMTPDQSEAQNNRTDKESLNYINALEQYDLISSIDISRLTPNSKETEINEIYSFLIYFEEELWGIMSGYQLKLDYNFSQLRDKIYSDMQECFNLFKNYSRILNSIESMEGNNEYVEKLHQTRLKESRGILVKFSHLMQNLKEFSQGLLQNYNEGGSLLSNAHEALKADEFSQIKKHKELTVLNGLQLLNQFATEIISYTNFPILKTERKRLELNFDE